MMRSLFGPKRAEPEAAEDNALARRFERRVALSRLALFAERVWEALLWPFLVIGAFLVVSLFDLWSVAPPLVHRVLLVAFGLALLLSLLPLIRLPLPSRAEALRRLERTADIKHRPASSYEDRLGTAPQGETALLWAAHRARLARLVAKLKPAWPEPRTDREDPYAIRAGLLILLAVAVLATGGDGFERLRAAFVPAPRTATALLRLDAWVTPPVYTGVAPIMLADGSEPVGSGAETFRALSVPERSELIVRAHSPQGESVTLVAGKDDGSAPEPVTPKTTNSQGLIEFNVRLIAPSTADVKIAGNTVAQWRFELIKDEPPHISLMGDPTATPRGALGLTFRADDDHGVASAEAKFALADGDEAGVAPPTAQSGAEPDPLHEPPVMPLPLPHANGKQIDGRASQDLTAHPWAGLKVRMTLAARDQAGQTGESQPYEFVLPERKFTKPLAKAVIEQRKKLVRDPDAADGVARALDALTLGGERVIQDSRVYLSLRNAYWRLQNDRSRQAIASIVSQLWEVALRIEDGDLPDAERAVKSAQDQLMQALKENAAPEELERLMNELRSALSKYLQAMAEQAQNKGNMPPGESKNGDQLVSQQDLDKMLNNIEKLAKSGSKELAENMLNELKDILDRLQTGNFADNAKQQRASRMMKDLSDVIAKQQKLLDDTYAAKRQQRGREGDQFEVSPPGQPTMEWGPGMQMAPFGPPEDDAEQDSGGGQNGQNDNDQQRQAQHGQKGHGQKPGQYGALGDRQGVLREKLQSLIDRLRIEGAKTPDQLDDAGEAMDDAKNAIGEENLDRAGQQQGVALDRLRKGAQSMAEQMDNGKEPGGKGQSSNEGRDPMGRPDNRGTRPDLGLSVKVPDEIDIQRAREVLDELRRRLGEPSRPAVELDYLERLVKPY
ncbi:MAG: TIGR02302 family protein [Methyloceanibacter sp.]